MINMEAKTSVSDSTGSSDTTVSTVTPTGADRQKPEAPKDNQEPKAPDEAPKAPEAPAVDWEKRYKDTQRALQEANEKLKNASKGTKETKESKDQSESKVLTQDEIRSLEQEYAENGGLTEDSYKNLEARGYPKEVVDDIIEARKTKAERLKNDTLAVIDSDTTKATEAYNTMIDWAKDNFSDEEASEYDKMISSGSLMQTKSAVSYLLQRYLAAAPKASATSAPSPTKGDASVPPTSDSGAYRSMAEMRKDLKDPRYQKDPAFRAMVDQKTLKAKSMGVL